MQKVLKAKVADFILDKTWSVPTHLSSKFSGLVSEINSVVIPTCDVEDYMIWRGAENAFLTFKESYNYLRKPICSQFPGER